MDTRMEPNHDGATSPYLVNCWYVVAWSHELSPGQHMKRILLDKPILLMRAKDGHVGAIGNVCPHRFASLSDGRFDGQVVECPYHGLRFSMDGRCIHNPHGNGAIAERAYVTKYPTIERYGAVWLWPGDPEKADSACVPDLSFLEKVPSDQRASSHLITKANYQLLSDNIMDLTHADFIHINTLSTGGAMARAPGKARIAGNTVVIEWVFDEGMAITRAMFPDQKTQTRLKVTWQPPGIMRLDTRIISQDNAFEPRDGSAVHIMTPETIGTTHYFFETSAIFGRADVAMAKRIFEEEDGTILEAVQCNMKGSDLWDLNPLILANDSGAVMSRRTLRRLMREENEAVVN
jgi:phenylpropionate dioxygenase-like ring-hydroxylating dioxygenase large terminal subunit